MGKHISIYIHIPFCIRKCRYCDFLSFPVENHDLNSYFNALKREIREETETAGRTADTVYFGGGTPSCVPPRFILEVMEELRKKYRITEDAEVSLEMNPGTLKDDGPVIYRDAGINRISLGVQSLNDVTLKRLGRIHSAFDVKKTYETLRTAGFNNINCDLISSVPGESSTDLKRSLDGIVAMDPSHISVYSLIIEPGTPLYDEYKGGGLTDLPNEDETADNDLMIINTLDAAGYERYEISNYSLPGKACRHNEAYWQRKEYRGFGPGAASLVGHRRFTNTRNMEEYKNKPGGILAEDIHLTKREEMEEFMFLGLRECKGVDKNDFYRAFGHDITDVFGAEIEKQKEKGFMEEGSGRYFYNTKGLAVSNVLMADFIEA